MKVVKIISIVLLSCSFGQINAQDLEDLMGTDEGPSYVSSTFKSTRIVTGQSVKMLAKGNLDFRMSHRFSALSGGLQDLFGLDGANARFSFDYGITDDLMVGVGRTSKNKIYDGFVKYKILKQTVGKEMPITLVWNSQMEITTVTKSNDDYPLSGRIGYAHQLLIARKISKALSVQLTPSVTHFNLVKDRDGANTHFALGTGFRYKLSNRVSLNVEYFYRLNKDDEEEVPSSSIYKNALSVGFDIETGGHVFQLHFTNSTSMTDASLIDRTTGDLSTKGTYFGFNFTRTF